MAGVLCVSQQCCDYPAYTEYLHRRLPKFYIHLWCDRQWWLSSKGSLWSGRSLRASFPRLSPLRLSYWMDSSKAEVSTSSSHLHDIAEAEGSSRPEAFGTVAYLDFTKSVTVDYNKHTLRLGSRSSSNKGCCAGSWRSRTVSCVAFRSWCFCWRWWIMRHKNIGSINVRTSDLVSLAFSIVIWRSALCGPILRTDLITEEIEGIFTNKSQITRIDIVSCHYLRHFVLDHLAREWLAY